MERFQGSGQLPGAALPLCRGAQRRGQAGGASPVQVHVVFPGVADRAEHQQRIERQIGTGGHRHHRGRRRGQPVLLERFVDRPHRVPGRRRGHLGVDQQHRGLVLQRLEGADRLAELFAGADVVHRHLDAASHGAAEAQAARATTTHRARSVGISESTADAGTRWSARCSTPTSVLRSVPRCCSTLSPEPEPASRTNHRSAPSPHVRPPECVVPRRYPASSRSSR